MMLLFLLVILLIYFMNNNYVKITSGKYTYFMSPGYKNSQEGTKMMKRMNGDIMKFLEYIQKKYEIDVPSKEINQTKLANLNPRHRIMFAHLLKNYNPEVIYEVDPLYTNDTAFMVNKGESFHVCLRNKDRTTTFVDYNTLMFVALHELSHIAAYNVKDHPHQFWKVFKLVLNEASNSGIYKPVNYKESPVNYCGLHVSYNPYFDSHLTVPE